MIELICAWTCTFPIITFEVSVLGNASLHRMYVGNIAMISLVTSHAWHAALVQRNLPNAASGSQCSEHTRLEEAIQRVIKYTLL